MSHSLHGFIARLPKVELHLHLEGSLRPETLEELARRKGWLKRKAGEWIADRQREHYRYGNFANFLRAFTLVSTLLEAPEDYALATKRLAEWLARQNVRYAEVIVSAGVILWKKQSVDAVFEAISAAASEAGERLGVRLAWIFDGVRQFGADHVREVLGYAVRYRDRGVVAFGIGGDEARGPAELFVDIYREAREQDLRLTAHAGESVGPESIRAAIELLGVERIGHGLTVLRDPEVTALVRERQIPLELCPSSNVSTGLIAGFGDHPLPQMLEAGLTVTLNSDDPGMFGTSLTQEFEQAASCFGLSPGQVVAMFENAIQASFLGKEEKAGLLEELSSAKGVVTEPSGCQAGEA